MNYTTTVIIAILCGIISFIFFTLHAKQNYFFVGIFAYLFALISSVILSIVCVSKIRTQSPDIIVLSFFFFGALFYILYIILQIIETKILLHIQRCESKVVLLPIENFNDFYGKYLSIGTFISIGIVLFITALYFIWYFCFR